MLSSFCHWPSRRFDFRGIHQEYTKRKRGRAETAMKAHHIVCQGSAMTEEEVEQCLQSGIKEMNKVINGRARKTRRAVRTAVSLFFLKSLASNISLKEPPPLVSKSAAKRKHHIRHWQENRLDTTNFPCTTPTMKLSHQHSKSSRLFEIQ